MIRKTSLLSIGLGFGLAALSLAASAQLAFHVALNTGSLNPANTTYAEFSLSDGSVASSGVPDTNNNATLSSFLFGGGSAGAVLAPNIGNASGDMTSSISLADGDPGGIADLTQAFTSGSSLSFNVQITTNVDAGGIPDELLFRLLDQNKVEIPTTDPSGNNGFFVLDLTSPTLTLNSVKTFGTPNGGIPPPVITAIPAGAPEPGALSLLAGGGVLGSLLALRRKRWGRTR
jgi:hypothetical protein